LPIWKDGFYVSDCIRSSKKSPLARQFERPDSLWGAGSLDSVQKYILYVFTALALLLLIKAAIKVLISALGKDEGPDSILCTT
jgi:hypothetical protein